MDPIASMWTRKVEPVVCMVYSRTYIGMGSNLCLVDRLMQLLFLVGHDVVHHPAKVSFLCGLHSALGPLRLLCMDIVSALIARGVVRSALCLRQCVCGTGEDFSPLVRASPGDETERSRYSSLVSLSFHSDRSKR